MDTENKSRNKQCRNNKHDEMIYELAGQKTKNKKKHKAMTTTTNTTGHWTILQFRSENLLKSKTTASKNGFLYWMLKQNTNDIFQYYLNGI